MLILLFTNWIQLTLVFRLIIYPNYSLYKSVRDYYGLFIALLSKFVRFVICAMFACVCVCVRVNILSYIALFIVTTWPPIQLSTRIGLTICNWPVIYMFISMCVWVCEWVYVHSMLQRLSFSQCTASMSRCARDIFSLSLGVLSSPDSRANIFIFSLNDSFSGTASPARCCCCCCCFSARRRCRGSLNR